MSVIERCATPLELDEGQNEHEEHINSTENIVSSFEQSKSDNSSAYKYQFTDGRRYHEHEFKTYGMPNDTKERNRLNMQHRVFRMCADGALYLAPIANQAQNVLDIGSGTGIWAIDFANEHPNSRVLGIDLSPAEPKDVPPNCSFRVGNVENDWDPGESFDFIHSRALVFGIKDWGALIQRCFNHLRPGGYLELQDACFPATCLDPGQNATSKVVFYTTQMMEAVLRTGSDMAAPTAFKRHLERAGFVEIHLKWYNLPLGSWPRSEKYKRMGRLFKAEVEESIGATQVMISKLLGKDPSEVKEWAEASRKEMVDESTRAYHPFCFAWARKPV